MVDNTVNYTPVTAPRGKVVHVTTLLTPQETACGIKFRGWVIAPVRVTCDACQLAVGLGVQFERPNRKRKAKRGKAKRGKAKYVKVKHGKR